MINIINKTNMLLSDYFTINPHLATKANFRINSVKLGDKGNY